MGGWYSGRGGRHSSRGFLFLFSFRVSGGSGLVREDSSTLPARSIARAVTGLVPCLAFGAGVRTAIRYPSAHSGFCDSAGLLPLQIE